MLPGLSYRNRINLFNLMIESSVEISSRDPRQPGELADWGWLCSRGGREEGLSLWFRLVCRRPQWQATWAHRTCLMGKGSEQWQEVRFFVPVAQQIGVSALCIVSHPMGDQPQTNLTRIGHQSWSTNTSKSEQPVQVSVKFGKLAGLPFERRCIVRSRHTIGRACPADSETKGGGVFLYRQHDVRQHFRGSGEAGL